MSKKATAAVENFIRESRERSLAVIQIAAQSVIDGAQLPRAKGGRMRVDTGFLRASGQASLNSMPTGPERNPFPKNTGTVYAQPEDATLTIAQMEIGDTLYFGWSANYARYREAKDGFLEIEVLNWQRHVDDAVKLVRSSGD